MRDSMQQRAERRKHLPEPLNKEDAKVRQGKVRVTREGVITDLSQHW